MKTLLAILALSLAALGQATVGGHATVDGNAVIGTASACCSDTFSGTSGTLLATHNSNWVSIDATWLVTSCQLGGSNTVQLTAAFGTCGAYYSTATADISQAVVPSGNTDNNYAYGPVIRASSANGLGYFLYFDAFTSPNFTGAEIAIGDAATFLCSGTGTWANTANHTLRITASGTTITAYIDGVQLCTATDSTYASGHPGIHINSPSGTYNLGAWQSY